MRAHFTATKAFAAAIRPEGSETRLRIRSYEISATVAGEAMTDVHIIDAGLSGIVEELDGRVLEDMMPGAATTLLGIASWSTERLALSNSTLVRVEVSSEGHRVSVER